MKKIFGFIIVAIIGFSISSFAQSTADKVGHDVKKGAKKTWHATKKAGKAVGNKTAEVASKSAAGVTDKKSDDWMGPNSQTIYIDDLGKYYWVDKKGHRNFVTEAELKKKH